MKSDPFIYRSRADRYAAVPRKLGHTVRLHGSTEGWVVEVLS